MSLTKIDWWKNNIEKKKLFDYVKNSKNFSQGPNIIKFEQALAKKLSVRFCVTTSSGSNALILAINCLNLKAGDEVIMPTRTWIATAHAALLFKLKIKLIDVDDRSLIDINDVQKKITNKTKVIMLVHLGGRTCEVDHFKKICKKKKNLLNRGCCTSIYEQK